jgi:Spy/CpxP family protein refolding chaperone
MLRRSIVFALPLALSAVSLAGASLGCSGTVTSEPVAASPDTATTRAPVAVNAKGHLKVIADALGDVPLTATQRAAIEKMAADADVRHADARAAHQQLALAIAAQVEAGQVDRAALQPKIDALVAAVQKAQPADRAAFEQLHALLTPDQRTAFVDAVEARVTEKMGAMHDKHPLKQWAADLQLTEAQKTQIHDAMKQRFQAMAQGHDHGDAPPWAHMHEQGAKLMAAFKQERFVMDEVSPPKDVAAKAKAMSDHVLGLAETALPVLTPQQRAIAAQKIRERAASGDEGMGL